MIGIIQKDMSLNQLTLNLNMLTVQLLSLKTMKTFAFLFQVRVKKNISYAHPIMEEVLSETYGVMLYQEQVMEIAQVLSNYTLGEADLLRRAMGKKIQKEMDAQKIRFIDGALKNSNELIPQTNMTIT